MGIKEKRGIRVAKVGMDSFLLDCHTNDNISEIEAEYGVKGFAVVVRLWQKIYSEKGYYCEWIERSPLLFLSNWFGGNSGVTVSLIKDIVSRCLKNGIFDVKMYEEYSILTSARIQKQYFDVVKRREEILVKKEYLLVSVDKMKGIAYENSISAYRNEKNVCRNDTRKEKERKEKRNKNTTYSSAEPDKPAAAQKENVVIELTLNDKTMYPIYQEEIEEWKQLYPSVDILQELRKMKGWCDSNPERRKTKRGIKRFICNWLARQQDHGGSYYQRQEEQKETYAGTCAVVKKIGTEKKGFDNFEQRTYDFQELERKLMG